MYNCKWRCFILFVLLTHSLFSQKDSASARLNYWLSFGPKVGVIIPGSRSLDGNPAMPGGEVSLNLEYKGVSCSIGIYQVTNVLLFNDILSDTWNQVTSVTFLVGPRYSSRKGSFIPSIGISAGIFDVTTGTAPPDYSGGYPYTPPIFVNHTHFTSDFVGLPISLKYMTPGKYGGADVVVYCNIHRYTDVGICLNLSFGKRY